MTDALGNLVRFELLAGQCHDTVGVSALVEGLKFNALIADKAFDSDAIVAEMNARGAQIVILQHPRRTKPLHRSHTSCGGCDKLAVMNANRSW